MIFFIILGLIIIVIVILSSTSSQEHANTNSSPQKHAGTYSPSPSISKQPENKQDANLLEQQRLVNQYVNSELLQQILNYICNGNYKLYKPREIIINHDNIKSDVSGRIIVFDFISNRVPVFEQVSGCIDKKNPETNLIRPQIAMAEAINKLMGNDYEIFDNAERIYREIRYNSDEGELLTIYKSNYVLMRLKSTKQF